MPKKIKLLETISMNNSNNFKKSQDSFDNNWKIDVKPKITIGLEVLLKIKLNLLLECIGNYSMS